MVPEGPRDADVQKFPPTETPAEPREATVEHALEESESQRPARERMAADPSTARGFHRKLLGRIPIFTLGGAALGALIGLLLVWGPGPLQNPLTGGPGRGTVANVAGAVGFIALCAIVFALVATALSGLIYTAREDGRTERRVEESTGEDPGAPAEPLDPKHDV
jgi:hypothetical protein